MVEILKKEYWSKSEAFLLPLTGLAKTQKYKMRSFLFWKNEETEYSIEDYFLILKFTWDNSTEFLEYCRRVVFPIVDRNGYLTEVYDFDHETVLVLNISEWALDIEMFIKGKYSKMSREAKDIITEFHTFYDKGPKILIEISASLEPNTKYHMLGNLSAIEYVAENYGFNLSDLKAGGELGGIYNKAKETLIIKTKEVAEGE